MTVKEYVDMALDGMDDVELAQVAEYVSLIRFRSRSQSISSLDTTQLAERYAEFADEDARLAEEGMGEYAQGLTREDRH